jgi:C1A family cysteine protease
MHRPYLLKKDKHDPRDFIYMALKSEVDMLPDYINLRSLMPDIFNQDQLGSCTANAIVAFREYFQRVFKEEFIDLSRNYLYWHERFFEGTVNEDSGAYIRDGMIVLTQIGCAPEVDFPYDISKFKETPSAVAEQDAGVFKIKEYHRVTNLDSMKHALANNLPVVIGIMVYDSFESSAVAENGVVPMPNKNNEQLLGGHAVLVVGYDDSKQVVIVRNSWGTGWGDQGYFTLPYDFINDPDLTHDMWTGTLSKPIPAPVEMTESEAVDLFTSKEIFDSPDFWKSIIIKHQNDPNSDLRFVGLAFIKIAKYMIEKGIL